MYNTCVLGLLGLLVGFAHCFSWDVVVGGNKQLNFYSNGTHTHTEEIPVATKIASVTYDHVRYRLLFTDVNYLSLIIFSYDITTGKIQPVITRKSNDSLVVIVYEPVTQLLFMKDGFSIYSFSLNPISTNKSDDGHHIAESLSYVRDMAVDSCGGYIYWITDCNIKKARFDGTQRQVIISDGSVFRLSLTIDQETQKMYWIDHMLQNNVYLMSIESADLNGQNRKRLYSVASLASALAVSKDFIYWQDINLGIWKLPKNAAEQDARKLDSIPGTKCWPCQHLAANYILNYTIQRIKSCEAVQDLILNNSKPELTVSICENYCLEGNCSINAEGKPTCSCKDGYTGKRCEVNACLKHCLHNGVCSLNEEDEPVCECTAGYEGDRCDVAITHAGDAAITETGDVATTQASDVAITHAGDCAVHSTQQVLQDLRSEVRQVFKEELKRILQLFSDKLDKD